MSHELLSKLDDLLASSFGIALTREQRATAIAKVTGGVSAGSETTRLNRIDAAMAAEPHIRGAMQFAIAECRRHNLRLTEELATDIDSLNIALSDKNVPTDARFRIKSSLAACGCID